MPPRFPRELFFKNKRGLRVKKKIIKRVSKLLNDPIYSCKTSTTSSSSIPSSFGVWLSVILWPPQRNLGEFIGRPCLWEGFFEFLELCCHFTLKWISLISCPMTLSLMYSPAFLSPKFSAEGFASWSDMVTVASSSVSAQQRSQLGRTSLCGLQIRLSST